jgi:GalNAc-alpha-(1->4)-GalNAc-alpha-(1->3)-diNAcBac-PP-undecaprenol alpha-1,4-N-acetyl-D-galactosaminyltransferase
MRITFTISQLEGGGAERVMTLLAKGFAQRGHAVTVITLSSTATDLYLLPKTVKRVGLNLNCPSTTLFQKLFNTLKRLIIFRNAVHESCPDIVIAFMADMNVFTVVALLFTGYPIIGTQHCSPSKLPMPQPWEALRYLTFPCLRKLVSVSKGVDSEFSWLPRVKREVIYNPILPFQSGGELSVVSEADVEKKWIVAMGRLVPEKSFDLLLKAFKEIAYRYSDWQLLILGEGVLRKDLENLRDDLDLASSVILPGLIQNPVAFLKQAKIFVLSSQTEGFPMALGEALACGLPAIATDCSGGIRELLRDGIDGIVVPNQDMNALAAAMERLMSDESERCRLAVHTPEVLERFSLDKVMDQWEKLIDKVVHC